MNSPDPASPASSFQWRESTVALVLVATVLAIYGQAVGFPFIRLDDPGYVYENAHVRAGLTWAGWHWAWTSFERSNWHPLTWLSLMFDAQLYGLDAGGFHLTNLLLHAANTLLLFRWLRLCTRALWPSALTAFLFAAHPLHVESVAWVTERKDVLSTFFFCLTLLAYSRYALGGPRRRLLYVLALACYALGLCAKPMLVSVPPLLLLLDYWPLRRFAPETLRAEWPRLLVEKLPFGALMAGSCLVTYAAQRGQAVVDLALLPAGFRLASAALGLGMYLQKTCWPVGLGVFYPYWYGVAWWRPALWGAVLVCLTAGALSRWRKQPYLAVGWLWFVGTLVPVLGLVQVGSQAVADRYTYLPHIGLFIALCWSGQAVWKRWRRLRAPLGVGVAAGTIGLLWLSIRQTHYWRDGASLFEHTIAVVPQPTARLYFLYADELANSGQEARAIRAYEQSWRLRTNDQAQEIALRLSALQFKAGQWEDVIGLLDFPSHVANTDKDLLNTLAAALLHTGERERAAALYRRCVQQYPEFAQGHFGLAECLRGQGDVPAACGEYEAGLALEGDQLSALTYLAWVYAHLDAPAAHERSLALARRALAVGRGQDLASLNALAAAEAATGHWPQAVEAARNAQALADRPSAPSGTAELCRARLASYEEGRLP